MRRVACRKWRRGWSASLAADYASQGDLAFRDGEEDADDEAVYYLLDPISSRRCSRTP